MAAKPRFRKDAVAESDPQSGSPSGPDLTHPVDEKLPPVKMFTSGLQHVAAMYAGVVAPPMIVGPAVGLDVKETAFLMGASLFTAGIATLLQTLGFWKIGAKLPFVNGVSFAGVTPMVAIGKDRGHDGIAVIFGAIIVAGILGFVLAPYFCKLLRFFPPVVTGTVITLIGVSLLPVAFNWSQGGNSQADDYGSMTNIGMAALTFVIVLALRKLLRGFLQQIAILLGLVIGTLIAIPVGITDFGAIRSAGLVGFPTPFYFGAPQFEIAAIISMCIVMLVCMTESTADMLALGKIVGGPADEKTVEGGLRADTLGSAISPLFNGFMCSAFAQNIGLVAMTKVRSRFVVAAGGGILILLGLCPVLASVIALVPLPVLGGAGIVLFGYGRGQRRPDPRHGRAGEGRERPDRRRRPRHRPDPDRGADVLPRLPRGPAGGARLGHQHRVRGGHRPQPGLQPLRQEGRRGRERHPAGDPGPDPGGRPLTTGH